MTTVLAVYSVSGCVGRCDANCHDAKGDACTCTCICQGLNHGFGFELAQSNVAVRRSASSGKTLIAFAEATKRDPKELVVVNRIKTPDMREARRQAHTRLKRSSTCSTVRRQSFERLENPVSDTKISRLQHIR